MAKSKSKSKPKPESLFIGRWHIVSMTEWDEDFINAEVQGFIEFGGQYNGNFQFGYVNGDMDYRLTLRDGDPAIEWTWDGNDEMDLAKGRGWAVLKDDELHGIIFFHEGDESGFVAKRQQQRPKLKKPKR